MEISAFSLCVNRALVGQEWAPPPPPATLVQIVDGGGGQLVCSV